MAGEIIAYLEMCRREGRSLQKGMNFRSAPDHSVILMSTRPNAPYADRIEEEGTVLIYEGHDEPRRNGEDPKIADQPEMTRSGRLTENGKFHAAAQAYAHEGRQPEHVQVYEKLRDGIWSDNGIFLLVDSWQEHNGQRLVFKFKLVAIESDGDAQRMDIEPVERRRFIPSAVKRTVWERDGGKCVQCGSTENLHFDHIIPWSRGGASDTAENVQLLCGRHNIQKGAKIE